MCRVFARVGGSVGGGGGGGCCFSFSSNSIIERRKTLISSVLSPSKAEFYYSVNIVTRHQASLTVAARPPLSAKQQAPTLCDTANETMTLLLMLKNTFQSIAIFRQFPVSSLGLLCSQSCSRPRRARPAVDQCSYHLPNAPP